MQQSGPFSHKKWLTRLPSGHLFLPPEFLTRLGQSGCATEFS